MPIWGYCRSMPLTSISIHQNTLFMPFMDEGSTLRWLLTLTTKQWHHFVSTSYPEPPNLTQVMWIELFEATTICRWTAYQCAQTLCLCLSWMQEAVWDGCQPQPWLITSFWLYKWPRTPKSDPSNVGIPIWGYCRSMPSTSISMCQNTLFMSVLYDGSTLRCMSTLTLNHNTMPSFCLHKLPSRTPKSDSSSVDRTAWEYYHMQMDCISMSKIVVGSQFEMAVRITMMQWHHFDSTSDPEPQNLRWEGVKTNPGSSGHSGGRCILKAPHLHDVGRGRWQQR